MNAVIDMPRHQGAGLVSLNNGRMATSDVLAHVAAVQELLKNVMKVDVHYGTIPGTPKPTLYKAGAELLCMVFRIGQRYELSDLSTADTVRYRSVCVGEHQLSGSTLGSGMGSASSGEAKYKWQKAYKEEFETTPEHMRRIRIGMDRSTKKKYETYQVRTEPADLDNTILKMANKRALIAMVLNVTAASDCFTQDLEDMEEKLRDQLVREGTSHGDEAHGDGGSAKETKAEPTYYPQADFDQNREVWKKVIAKGKTPDAVIETVNKANARTPLSPAQEKAIRDLAPAAKPAGDGPVQWAHAEVLTKMSEAKDEDALNLVMDAASQMARPDAERAAENAKYDACLTALRK